MAKSQGLFSPLLSSFGGKKGDLGFCLFCPATHLNGVIRWPPDWIWVVLLLAMVSSEEKGNQHLRVGDVLVNHEQNLLVEKKNQPWWKKNQKRAPFPDFKVCK